MKKITQRNLVGLVILQTVALILLLVDHRNLDLPTVCKIENIEVHRVDNPEGLSMQILYRDCQGRMQNLTLLPSDLIALDVSIEKVFNSSWIRDSLRKGEVESRLMSIYRISIQKRKGWVKEL